MTPDGSDCCKVDINIEQLDDSTGDVAFEKNHDWLVGPVSGQNPHGQTPPPDKIPLDKIWRNKYQMTKNQEK